MPSSRTAPCVPAQHSPIEQKRRWRRPSVGRAPRARFWVVTRDALVDSGCRGDAVAPDLAVVLIDAAAGRKAIRNALVLDCAIACELIGLVLRAGAAGCPPQEAQTNPDRRRRDAAITEHYIDIIIPPSGGDNQPWELRVRTSAKPPRLGDPFFGRPVRDSLACEGSFRW